MQSKQGSGLSFSQMLFPEEKAEFEALKEKVCLADRPRTFRRNRKTKERASRYKPWVPSKSDDISPQSIRYIGTDEVDWFLDREMIIVPKDYETVEKLEKLEKSDARMIWNFARSPADIKWSDEVWQNILICA